MTVKQLIYNEDNKINRIKNSLFSGINHNMADKSHGIYIYIERERETLLSD